MGREINIQSRPLGWTTLEESERLLEAGLSPDTADMWYAERIPKKIEGWNLIQNGDAYYYLSLEKSSENNWSIDTINDIPCWSLGALMNIIKRTDQKFDISSIEEAVYYVLTVLGKNYLAEELYKKGGYNE